MNGVQFARRVPTGIRKPSKPGIVMSLVGSGRKGEQPLMEKAVGLYSSTLGKKVLMAVTGIILFGYLVGHMLGNLQIFMGPEQINRYVPCFSASVCTWPRRFRYGCVRGGPAR